MRDEQTLAKHTAQVQSPTVNYAPSHKVTPTGQTCLIYISHVVHNLNVFVQQ